ncbi:MAG: ABC transporter permease [Planctomycetota bacterium]
MADHADKRQNQSYWAIVRRQFFKRRLAVVGLVLVIGMLMTALLAPLLANNKPIVASIGGRLCFPAFVDYWEAFPVPDFVRLPLQRDVSMFSPRYDFLGNEEWKDFLTGRVRTEGELWGGFHKGAGGDWALMPLIPYDFKEQHLAQRNKSPSDTELAGTQHYLGTDGSGRDVAARMIHGCIVAMTVGILSVGIYCTIGIFLGAIAGYFGGWVDMVFMRVVEVFLCFPTLFLILAVAAAFNAGIYGIVILLGLIRWTGPARLIRGEILKNKQSDYVIAARALGLSNPRVIFRHLVPNSLAPVLVSATFGISTAILIESSLSFLGFGVKQPMASWGEIGKQGRELLSSGKMYLAILPGLATFVTITAFNLVGEGLRDAMDPRLKS